MVKKHTSWCRILEVDGEQVLFYYQPHPSAEKKWSLHQAAYVNGLCNEIVVSGISKKDAQKALDGVTQEDAVEVYRVLTELTADVKNEVS